MMTAVSASSGRRNSLLSRVVLPLPRKPVSTVTGMRCSAAFCVSLMIPRLPKTRHPDSAHSHAPLAPPRMPSGQAPSRSGGPSHAIRPFAYAPLRSGLASFRSPKPLGFPEPLPRLLELVAPALFAGGRLLGQFAQCAAHVFRRTGRNGDVGHHLAGHRAIVQGAERALQA